MTGAQQIGPILPHTGRPSTARIGPWTSAGLITGGCLGCVYGIAVGLATGLNAGGFAIPIGTAVGLILGSVIGFLIGLTQIVVRHHAAIPGPVIAVAVTELILLPPQILSVRLGWHQATLTTGLPSAFILVTTVVLAWYLPQAGRRLRRTDCLRGGDSPYGATGLRLRAYRRRWLAGQVLDVALAEAEVNAVLEAGHVADRDEDLPAAPRVPSEDHVGDTPGARDDA
jgi:ABC-type dipeptide/oligopeptide/nickel transport system permease subunit